ncbi:MAG: Jag N-terminal domain-containing protein [Desulfobacterales bacterium]|nr:Jag N-terminal domain-containing protein [Desulfobacterales bacterium]
MSDFLDFEGKSVEQAVEKACQELDISKEELVYDIISYGSTGIFGLVRTKKALIRVQPPKTEDDAPADGVSENPVAETVPEAATEAATEADAEGNRSTINALLDETFGETAEKTEVAPPAEPPSADTEKALSIADALLRQILNLLSAEFEMSVHHDKDQYRIHIRGAEPAVLIGRKGQTLEAMQYLVDKVVNKQCGKGFRIVVDVEGYLETRRNELTEMADRLADRARRTGKPSTMSRMNAHDRRIVHLALKNNKTVRTQSVGDGYYRKLMILPKRRKNTSKAGSRGRQSQ